MFFAILTVFAAVFALLRRSDEWGTVYLGSIAALLTLMVGSTLIGSTTVEDRGIWVRRTWRRRFIVWGEGRGRRCRPREWARGRVASVEGDPGHGEPFKAPAPIHSVP